jgi:carboxynorspermidine decarboxylase
VVEDLLGDHLPAGVEGLHFHTLCESDSNDLERTLQVVDEKFGKYFSQIKWLNMGGGHLMTRDGYNVDHLINILQTFKAKYPHLQLILEPGSAFAWRTGVLVSTVVDIVENRGIKTAMLDVSFSCHMPDCLEMPYKPAIVGATDPVKGKPTYRMGGNSCLSGDFYGDWTFDQELKIGDRVVFEDMIHYTMVKTTMFNGVSHPSIGIWTKENTFNLVRKFGYEDFKRRLS